MIHTNWNAIDEDSPRCWCEECGVEMPRPDDTDMVCLCDECRQNPPDVG